MTEKDIGCRLSELEKMKGGKRGKKEDGEKRKREARFPQTNILASLVIACDPSRTAGRNERIETKMS